MNAMFDDYVPQHAPPGAAGLQRKIDGGRPLAPRAALAGVRQALTSPGQELDAAAQAEMGARFGHDFTRVRLHTDSSAAQSARALNAQAYTFGQDIVFGAGKYDPYTPGGKSLLAHELAHVAQQGGGAYGGASLLANGPAGESLAIDGSHEAEAERAEQGAGEGASPAHAPERVSAPAIQRKVEMRAVPWAPESGYPRLPELVERLNTLSSGLAFAMKEPDLTYTLRPGGVLSDFDRQMQAFIDQPEVIPLRLVNREALVADEEGDYIEGVVGDLWQAGYVDIDDLLASDDLGLQTTLAHFLRERAATPNYARRIGSESLDERLPGPGKEFDRVHDQGIQAEEQVLRDYFGDPTIRAIRGVEKGNVIRAYLNGRGDSIYNRVRKGTGKERGVEAFTYDIRTRDGRRFSAPEYRRLLEEERTRAQVERERLMGATEHREGGRSVPAP